MNALKLFYTWISHAHAKTTNPIRHAHIETSGGANANGKQKKEGAK